MREMGLDKRFTWLALVSMDRCRLLRCRLRNGRVANIEEYAVLENGIRFLVRPHDGHSTGLFLEHRDNRKRVRRLAAGRNMLNAFAYTCGFSVAAALGGAAGTVSVDVSKKYLEWGKCNFAANELNLADHRFICSDIFDYYRRARRRRHARAPSAASRPAAAG